MPSLEIGRQEILEVRSAVLETVRAGSVKPEELRKRVETARAVLGGGVATMVVKRWDDAVVVPAKIDLEFPDGTYIHPWRYSRHYARIYNLSVLYDAIASILTMADRTYRWDVLTALEVTSREGREALAKLVIADALIDDALAAAHLAERAGLLTWASTTATNYMKYRCTETPNPTNSITCITKRAIAISRALRWKVASNAEGWLKALEERVERHNGLARMVGGYITEIVRDGECEFGQRCAEYLNHYPSYVEYSKGVVRYVVGKNWERYRVLALLGGAEDTRKYFRAKLDIIAVADLDLREPTPLGSWLIGRDKVTNQEFAIALTPRCVNEGMRKCVEYVLGLRNDNLERVVRGRVRVVEV